MQKAADGEMSRTAFLCCVCVNVALGEAVRDENCLEVGVGDGDRTRDIRCHRPTLYQLSYSHHPPTCFSLR
jgi:hypothetical protein